MLLAGASQHCNSCWAQLLVGIHTQKQLHLDMGIVPGDITIWTSGSDITEKGALTLYKAAAGQAGD